MSEIFLSVLKMSAYGSIAAIIVMLVRLCLKRTPKIFSYALWGIVFFRLLCPFGISVPIILHTPSQHTSDENTVHITAHEAPEHEDITLNDSEVFITETPTAVKEENRLEPQTPLAINWLIGVGFATAWSVYSYIRLNRRMRTAILKYGRVYESDRIETAFLHGIVRPKIYIPSGLSETQRDYVIKHEQSHLRRCDHIAKLIAYCALAIHWFNPLIWLCFELMCRDMEQSCDEAVVCGFDRKSIAEYCETLLILKTKSSYPVPAFSESNISKRIKNIVSFKKPKHIFFSFIPVLFIFLLCACSVHVTLDENEVNIPQETSSTDISIDGLYSQYVSQDTPLYIEIEDGEAFVRYCYRSYIGNIDIPSTYDGVPVMTIDSEAFRGCTGINIVLIGNAVTRIKEYAFSGCTNLSRVEFPVSLIKIDAYAFSGCASMTSVVMPQNLRTVGAYAFENCAALQRVEMSDGIAWLEDGVFSGCTSLRNIKLSDYLVSIGASAFSGCTSLKEIDFPMNLVRLNDRAFYMCRSLEKINGLDYVYHFGDEVFTGCSDKLKLE